MPTSPGSRASGIEFAVGWFLAALGCGVLVPRKGFGLYSMLHDSGYPYLWSAVLIASGITLVAASLSTRLWLRLPAVVAGFACWTALAFRFIDASLWGATMQACVAIVLLNGCFFGLFRRLKKL